MTTPSIRALKKSFPEAKIMVLVDEPYFDVISKNPYIDEIVLLNRSTSIIGILKIGLMLKKRKFDITIDYLANPRSAFLTLIIGSPIRIGLKKRIRRIAYNLLLRKLPGSSSYVADYRLNAIRLLGKNPDGLEMDFYIDADQTVRAQEFLASYKIDLDEKFVTISPVSLGKWKLWPFKEFAATADYLITEYRLKTILICGPGEYHFLMHVKKLMKNEPAAMIEFKDLKTAGYLLSKSCLHIGNDGGLNHLSAAVRTPTITIFGPGDANGWNNNQNPRLVAITKEMSCRHKKCHRKCRFNYECLNALTLADLKAPIDRLLSSFS